MDSLGGLDLGTFGIYAFDFEHESAAQLRVSIEAIETAGWRTFWFPELLGREAFTLAGLLLSYTERLHVGNAIAQIWSREAKWTHGAATLLADAYPDRHLLGLGFGGAPRAGVSPLAGMNAYLDELDALARPDATPNPAPRAPIRRLLAAYGPKMLALARDRAAGALTYHVTVEHTAQARQILGPDRFLGVEHTVLFERDPSTARALAREHLAPYLSTPFNLAKLRRLDYTERDLADGGSDRLVDDLCFWGDLDAIATRLRRHVDAGADHVAIQVIGTHPGDAPVAHWRALAEALAPVG